MGDLRHLARIPVTSAPIPSTRPSVTVAACRARRLSMTTCAGGGSRPAALPNSVAVRCCPARIAARPARWMASSSRCPSSGDVRSGAVVTMWLCPWRRLEAQRHSTRERRVAAPQRARRQEAPPPRRARPIRPSSWRLPTRLRLW